MRIIISNIKRFLHSTETSCDPRADYVVPAVPTGRKPSTFIMIALQYLNFMGRCKGRLILIYKTTYISRDPFSDLVTRSFKGKYQLACIPNSNYLLLLVKIYVWVSPFSMQKQKQTNCDQVFLCLIKLKTKLLTYNVFKINTFKGNACVIGSLPTLINYFELQQSRSIEHRDQFKNYP